MTITTTPEQDAALQHFADQRGVTPQQIVSEFLAEQVRQHTIYRREELIPIADQILEAPVAKQHAAIAAVLEVIQS